MRTNPPGRRGIARKTSEAARSARPAAAVAERIGAVRDGARSPAYRRTATGVVTWSAPRPRRQRQPCAAESRPRQQEHQERRRQRERTGFRDEDQARDHREREVAPARHVERVQHLHPQEQRRERDARLVDRDHPAHVAEELPERREQRDRQRDLQQQVRRAPATVGVPVPGRGQHERGDRHRRRHGPGLRHHRGDRDLDGARDDDAHRDRILGRTRWTAHLEPHGARPPRVDARGRAATERGGERLAGAPRAHDAPTARSRCTRPSSRVRAHGAGAAGSMTTGTATTVGHPGRQRARPPARERRGVVRLPRREHEHRRLDARSDPGCSPEHVENGSARSAGASSGETLEQLALVGAREHLHRAVARHPRVTRRAP